MTSLKFICICLLITLSLCVKTSFKAGLKNAKIQEFKTQLWPRVMEEIPEHISIPDLDEESGIFKVQVRNGQAHIFPISSSQVSLTFIPNSHEVAVSIRGLKVEGSAHVKAKAGFISKSTNARVEADGIDFSARCTLGQNKGKIAVNIHSVNAHIGDLDIHLDGGFIDDILEWVVNLLHGVFEDKIEDAIKDNVPSAVNDLLVDILNTIPYNIEIDGGLMMTYSFPEAPIIVGDEFRTTTLGYMYPTKNPHAPPYDPSDMPFDSSCTKGIQILISDYLVRSGLDTLYEANYLNYTHSVSIMDRPMTLVCQASQEPSLLFANPYIDVSIAAGCGVTVTLDGEIEPMEFSLTTEVIFKVQEHLERATIFFNIDIFEVLSLTFHGPYTEKELEWFRNMFNDILEGVIEGVNQLLGAKGVPLPSVDEVDYTDTVQTIKKGYIEICSNPKLRV